MSIGPAKEFYIDANGGRQLCITFGRGSRSLVLIPGLRLSSLRGSGAVSARYYRLFSEAYTVYIFDRKEPLLPGCTIHDLAEDLAAAMDRLGLRGADVLGASQGGMIAQDLAIHHPELVHKMVLAVTASRRNPVMEDAIRTWIALLEKHDIDGFARDYMRRGFSEAYCKKYAAFLPLVFRLQKPMPTERFINLAEACLTCRSYEELDRIRCPVLVIGGGRDRVVSAEASREIAEKLHCACYMYDELSHEAYSEAKDFNRRVYEFLCSPV